MRPLSISRRDLVSFWLTVTSDFGLGLRHCTLWGGDVHVIPCVYLIALCSTITI